MAFKRRDLSKGFMVTYIRDNGTDEDKAWFKEAVQRNTVARSNKLIGDFKDINIKSLRTEFIERFDEFKNLSDSVKAKNFFDEVDNL